MDEVLHLLRYMVCKDIDTDIDIANHAQVIDTQNGVM